MTRKPDPAKRLQWAERLQRFRRSKQTVTQFCQAEGISVPSLYAWAKRLGHGTRSRPAVQRRERKLPTRAALSAPGFQRVRLTAAAQPAGATIRFPNGVVLELNSDLPTIEHVVRQLLDHQLTQGADAC